MYRSDHILRLAVMPPRRDEARAGAIAVEEGEATEPPAPPPVAELARMIRQVRDDLVPFVDRGDGVTAKDIRVLSALRTGGRPCIADLKRRLLIDEAELGHITRRLADRGLLVRARKGDRRSYRLSLTLAGQMALERAARAEFVLLEDMLLSLSPEHQAAIRAAAPAMARLTADGAGGK